MFVAGFLVNFVNPFVLTIWIAFVEIANQEHSGGEWVFLAGILMAIFCTDLLKAWAAPALRNWLNPQRMTWFFRGLGLVMLLFALRLFAWAW